MSSLKRGSLEPVVFAHQPGPALEQRIADHLDQDPAVARLEDVDRSGGLAAVSARRAIDVQHGLLDQQGVADRQRGAQQRALDHLAEAGLLFRHQGQRRAVGAMQGGAEIDPGRLGAIGALAVRLRGHVDRARHHLADAVEADPVAIGPALAIGGDHGQDDVGLDRLEAVVVQLHRRQGLGRQIGHHDVRRLDQPAHHVMPARLHRIQRHAALVAVHLHEEAAFAVGGDRGLEAVLAAGALFDPDHVRAEFGQQRRAVGPGDVAPEIQDANARQHLVQGLPPYCRFSLRMPPIQRS